MNWLLILKRFLAFLALVIWMAVLFSVGSTYLGPKMAGSLSPAETNFAGIALLIVCTVDTLLLGAFILLARIYGWRLLVITMLLYYGVKTFQANIEAVYFMLNITPDLVPKLFTMTLPVTLFWPPLAVWLLGKARKPATALVETSSLPQTSAGTWVWKFALIGIVVYPLLFFSFGYYVAWKNAELRAFYQGTDPGSFLLQMRNLIGGDPLLLPFEFFRGLLWAGMAALMIWTMKDRPWLAAVLLAIFFALIENDVHLFPNPLMPTIVRQTHFIETASSNLLFGLIAAALLMWRPTVNQDRVALTQAVRHL
ncbi:MAG: hypothetical protein U0175_18835 [Caldilineaceae bacterium]